MYSFNQIEIFIWFFLYILNVINFIVKFLSCNIWYVNYVPLCSGGVVEQRLQKTSMVISLNPGMDAQNLGGKVEGPTPASTLIYPTVGP